MESFANAITKYYVKRKYIPEDKQQIYYYGFKLILADIINFSLVLLISLILRDILSGIVFLITLCSIRRFSGGFHAKSFWLCRLSLLATFFGVIISSRIVSLMLFKLSVITVFNFLCVIVIGCLSPIKHPNKHLSPKLINKNKTKAIITSLVLSVIAIILVALDMNLGVTISMTIVSVVILMVVAIIMKGGKKDV